MVAHRPRRPNALFGFVRGRAHLKRYLAELEAFDRALEKVTGALKERPKHLLDDGGPNEFDRNPK